MKGLFAPEYPVNEDGLLLFPSDADYRKSVFKFWDRLGISLSEHPAKANTFLIQAIVEFVSEIEETVMDIMAGTGTIMIAALAGRRVVCIEIEDSYIRLLEEAVTDINSIAPGAEEAITIIEGDCTKVLPLPVADHIVFSPPYAQIMRKKKLDKLSAEMLGEGLLKYSKHPDNIGNLNEFLYHQKMEVIYRKCFQSLPPGGTLAIIIKDHIESGERVYLGNRAKRDCVREGFVEVGHYKWLAPGSAYIGFMRARGDLVVEDEDIIILRRP